MSFASYTARSADQIAGHFQTDSQKGLTGHEAAARLVRFGNNEVTAHDTGWWELLFRQVASPFVYLLFAAAVIAFFLGEQIDALMIGLFVTVNTSLGFIQEFRSHQALKLLRRYIVGRATVIRDGQEMAIHSRDVVTGDVIKLEPGDIIPADIRLTQVDNLLINESILTGESVPVSKTHEAFAAERTQMHEAKNIGFSGTTVEAGMGTGIVVATGASTAIGETAKLTAETSRVSSFEKSLRRFSAFIVKLIGITLVLVFAANLLIKGDSVHIGEQLVFSIALAVSVIPEALLVVMTFSLSRGAIRLAKHKVVVKRLSAIEDLGSIEVLCTDKTGTLTENELVVKDVYGDKTSALLYGAYAFSSPITQKEPDNSFDRGIWGSLSEKQQSQAKASVKIHEIPFDPERRRNSVLIRDKTVERLVVRGAPEAVYPYCDNVRGNEKQKLIAWIKAQGDEGNRVLAIATKTLKGTKAYTKEEEKKGLTLVGAVAFEDPIKPAVRDAIVKAKRLGVTVKILTGDAPEVAGAVGKLIGLLPDSSQVLTGEMFDRLSAEKQGEAVVSHNVFARVSPQQKYRIIQVLQERHEVGFLGEGINDAPALKVANVALVVDHAADVARESADIVLLKKSLHVIIDGIEEGRMVFANTMKYIKATMSANFGNFYAVALASLVINYLPMLPLQILLVNLLSDMPMIAIATDTVDHDELARPKNYDMRHIIVLSTALGVVSSVFDFIVFGIFSRFSPAVLQTNWFVASIVTELLFLYSIRTNKFMFAAKPASLTLLVLTASALVITIGIPYSQIGKQVFQFISPTVSHLQLIGLIAFSYVFVSEIVKLLYYRIVTSTANGTHKRHT